MHNKDSDASIPLVSSLDFTQIATTSSNIGSNFLSQQQAQKYWLEAATEMKDDAEVAKQAMKAKEAKDAISKRKGSGKGDDKP